MKKATDPQKNYIESLLRKKHGDDIEAAIREMKPSSSAGRFTTVRQTMREMSKSRASDIIDALKAGRNVPIA